MQPERIAGFVLMAGGVALFVIGMNASRSVADRWSNFFTGHFTDSTMWLMFLGIAAAFAGVVLLALRGRKSVA